MELRMKTENAAAQHPLKHFVSPRADGERFRIRPWYVPEGDDRGIRERLAYHLRQQGEMVVLHEDYGCFRLGLAYHRLGKLAIHRDILLPVACTHDGFQYRDQPAGRVLHLDLLPMALVDVGFEVANHDPILAAQFAVENG